MLPFLKHQTDASASHPPEKIVRKPDSEEGHSSLLSAAEDLIQAVHSNDAKAVAEALQTAFELAKYEGQDD